MRALADAGLLRILAPRSYGGEEADGLAFMELVERVARVDGSAAWTAMTLNEEIEISAAYLPAVTMTKVCRSAPAVIVAGSGATLGRARRVEGGWRLSGAMPMPSTTSASCTAKAKARRRTTSELTCGSPLQR